MRTQANWRHLGSAVCGDVSDSTLGTGWFFFCPWSCLFTIFHFFGLYASLTKYTRSVSETSIDAPERECETSKIRVGSIAVHEWSLSILFEKRNWRYLRAKVIFVHLEMSLAVKTSRLVEVVHTNAISLVILTSQDCLEYLCVNECTPF